MRHNIICCCHKCKVKLFLFRNSEQKGILPFYKKHAQCAKEDIDNVCAVMDNNGTDQEWVEDFPVGYEDDSIQDNVNFYEMEELRKIKESIAKEHDKISTIIRNSPSGD